MKIYNPQYQIQLQTYNFIQQMQNLQQGILKLAQKLHQDKVKRQQKFLKQLIDDQSTTIILQYCQKILKQKITQPLNDYSPIRISQQVLQAQLHQIKLLFNKLPSSQCKLEHFLIIMIQVMEFPFEKIPYYLIGLKDMFNEIVPIGEDSIKYDMLFKYILGQTIIFKQEQNNTEFQMRFQEQKKQDYFVHDTGIKKMLYIKDLKVFVTLDLNSQYVKVYNLEMKVIRKIGPSKEKHFNKHPIIIDFGYSEISHRLGLLLSDCTLSLIHLENFIKKTIQEFNLIQSNQITLLCPYSSRFFVYLQMINKWCVVTQKNIILLFDADKYKQQIYYDQLQLDHKDQSYISIVQEIVSINTICLVIENQVTFYNESFTTKKQKKYKHMSSITNFHYYPERNKFYIAGHQKIITVLEIIKNTDEFKITYIDPNFKYNILSFEVFPFMSTIIFIDDRNEVKIYNQTKGICEHSQSYKHIVKNSKQNLQIYKINKTNFAIFETYLILMSQNKVSIEKDIEYNFQDYLYFDQKKQNLYLSVNKQIINFSLVHAQIRQNYSKETSNMIHHEAFFLGENTNLFVLDKNKNLFEPYFNDQKLDRDNRNYKKRLTMESVVKSFYYQYKRTVIIVSHDSICQTTNQRDNNFNTISICTLENISQVVQAQWRPPIITLLNKQHVIYQLHFANYSIFRSVEYIFPQKGTQFEEGVILCLDHDFDYGFDIILSNLNEIHLVSMIDETKQYLIKIKDYLLFKDKDMVFTSMKYQKLGKGKSNELYLIIFNELGYFGEFQLKNIVHSFLSTLEAPPNPEIQQYKDNKTIKFKNVPIKKIKLCSQTKEVPQRNHFRLIKAHEKAIQLVSKIHIQFPVTLTVSKDGYTKLWLKQQCLFSLKLPLLTKAIWNMSKIQESKTQKSVKKLLSILQQLKLKFKTVFHISPIKTIQKSRRIRKINEVQQINYDQPLKIQLQNKQFQDIINQSYNEPMIKTHKKQWKKRIVPHSINPYKTVSGSPRPWRKNKQFIKLIQKASPEPKNKCSIPKELLTLRKTLDMAIVTKTPQVKSAKIITPLLILPELNSYIPQQNIEPIQTQNQEQEQVQKLEVFESCMYVKRNKFKKRINELDQIDKQFKKKWMQLTNKKWIPHKKNLQENNNVEKITSLPKNIGKVKIKDSPNIIKIKNLNSKQQSLVL